MGPWENILDLNQQDTFDFKSISHPNHDVGEPGGDNTKVKGPELTKLGCYCRVKPAIYHPWTLSDIEIQILLIECSGC